MSVLSGKKILLGITGGIAAYKSAYIIRLLIKAGAEVKVLMTPASKEFVTSLTLSTLSKNPVLSTFTNEEDDNAVWNSHVELGLWADYFLIAPATANTLSKMANGTSDNLLIATYLSAKCPVYIAPAMDLDMYKHPTTHESLEKLTKAGDKIIPVGSGELASGLSGEGRMAEPEDVVHFLEADVLQTLPLREKKVLVTAGPTYEPIDPVRFIGNHSSGRMGFAIAEEAANLGAEVFLVSGPTALEVQHPSVQITRVTSAEEMFETVHSLYERVDIVIMAAAVADYTPVTTHQNKIKKNEKSFSLELKKTKDILAALGERKTNQILVGFALETNDELENAKRKLKKKNLDLIVLNSLNDDGAGFGGLNNKVTFINKNGAVVDYDLKSKQEVATDIFTYILENNYA